MLETGSLPSWAIGRRMRVDVFLGVAEGALLAGSRSAGSGSGSAAGLGQVVELEVVLLDPEVVGLAAADLVLELVVADQAGRCRCRPGTACPAEAGP